MIRTEGTGAWACEGNSNNNIINIKRSEAKRCFYLYDHIYKYKFAKQIYIYTKNLRSKFFTKFFQISEANFENL